MTGDSAAALTSQRGVRLILRATAIGAVVAIYLTLVGIVAVFHRQDVIPGVLTMGQGSFLAILAVAGYLATRVAQGRLRVLLLATLVGALVGLSLTLLMVLAPVINLRLFSQHATAVSWNILTLGRFDEPLGPLVPVAVGAVMGAAAGGVALLPGRVRESLVLALLTITALGLFASYLRIPLIASPYAWLGRDLFGPISGLTFYGTAVAAAGALGVGVGGQLAERFATRRRGGAIGGAAFGVLLALLGGQLLATLTRGMLASPDALAIGAIVGGVAGIVLGGLGGGLAHGYLHAAKVDEVYAGLPTIQRRVIQAPAVVALLLVIAAIPHAMGPLVALVVALVALYIMMGLGLNVTLGMAGLLDLGFVAFLAVGGYTVGLLTSTGPQGLNIPPFSEPGGWFYAVPIAVILAFLFGALLGLPVLGIRGDYLAIATLGFGEIVRITVGSDLLSPLTGGPHGVTHIPPPFRVSPEHPLSGPTQIYYLALVAAAFIAFLSVRLRDSRMGRAWLAIREDEDVAEALGINLVQTKLLAYSLGAAFAGLGGAVFVGLIGAIFHVSISLLVSINIAAIVIIGGMGSIPGVVVGAIILIGLPELFREFAEYRWLFYGVALVLLMRFRPEGLLPSRSVQRELHAEDENVDIGGTAGAAVAARKA